MEKILVKDSRDEILERCKLDNANVSFILDLAKVSAKRGRKSYEDMTDDELYKAYVSKCEKQSCVALSKDMWSWFNLIYDWEDLLSTEDIEESDPRNWIETRAYKLGYIGDELDYEALDSLYKIIFKALRKRLVIILNLEDIPSLINSAISSRCQDCNCNGINATMHSRLTEIQNILEDKEVKQWLNTGASDMSLEASDYVTIYQQVLRQISSIRNEPLEYFRDIIHNEYDIFEDEIIKNDSFDISYFSENIDYDEEGEDDYLD